MISIGVDVLKFERLSLSVQDQHFLEKNFTEFEIKYRKNALNQNKAVYFSKILSCKEAIFKAMNIEAVNLRNWREIEIILQNGKAPEAKIDPALTERLNLSPIEIQLSLSYETDFICAVALVISGG